MPKPTSVRLPQPLRERLTAAAVEERRTFSNLLRVLVEDGLAQREAKTSPRRTAAR
jgi:predicted DNA-binding protein